MGDNSAEVAAQHDAGWGLCQQLIDAGGAQPAQHPKTKNKYH